MAYCPRYGFIFLGHHFKESLKSTNGYPSQLECKPWSWNLLIVLHCCGHLNIKYSQPKSCNPWLFFLMGRGENCSEGWPSHLGQQELQLVLRRVSYCCQIDQSCHTWSLLSLHLAQNQPLSLLSQAVLTPGDRILMWGMTEALELMCARRWQFWMSAKAQRPVWH